MFVFVCVCLFLCIYRCIMFLSFLSIHVCVCVRMYEVFVCVSVFRCASVCLYAYLFAFVYVSVSLFACSCV